LDEIPSGSDLSDNDSDSGDDETYKPKGAEDDSSSDDGELDVVDEGPQEEVGGIADDIEEENLPDIDDAVDLVCPAGPSEDAPAAELLGPAPKRRIVNRERPLRAWLLEDLPPQVMPDSTVKPMGLEDCDTDVSVFLKMFGVNNISLLTRQTNLLRAARTIEKNKSAAAISEREIKQVMGILMYMSIVTLPNTKMFWSASLRNNMVAGVMTRDRFEYILSCLHLSDNSLQPPSSSASYDRLYKVREFLSNLASNFAEHAVIEEVCSVDEQMIPFKGQLGIKVYMKGKPKKWGVKVIYICTVHMCSTYTSFVFCNFSRFPPLFSFALKK
jgi:hypothetical protein